jgi:hypothetical protein
MSTTAWIVVAIIVVAIVVIAIAWTGIRRRRLQSRFGPEYQRVATESGSKWRADSELASRQQRRQKLDIRELSPEQRSRYARDWQQIQADFVDQPYESVAQADRLVTRVMQDRGYPMENFDQHANDLSVDYPQLVDNYRGAHAIATRQKSANTEELRKAMLHYRNLFQELLGEPADGQRASKQSIRDERTVGQEPTRESVRAREQTPEEARTYRERQQ